jgi:CRP/FNR family transcriptional regulator
MTRQEIGSYLGIKLETVSRTLSALAAHGLISVDRRTVTLNDIPALRRILERRDPGPAQQSGTLPAAARVSPPPEAKQRGFLNVRNLAVAAV